MFRSQITDMPLAIWELRIPQFTSQPARKARPCVRITRGANHFLFDSVFGVLRRRVFCSIQVRGVRIPRDLSDSWVPYADSCTFASAIWVCSTGFSALARFGVSRSGRSFLIVGFLRRFCNLRQLFGLARWAFLHWPGSGFADSGRSF